MNSSHELLKNIIATEIIKMKRLCAQSYTPRGLLMSTLQQWHKQNAPRENSRRAIRSIPVFILYDRVFHCHSLNYNSAAVNSLCSPRSSAPWPCCTGCAPAEPGPAQSKGCKIRSQYIFPFSSSSTAHMPEILDKQAPDLIHQKRHNIGDARLHRCGGERPLERIHLPADRDKRRDAGHVQQAEHHERIG